ncbi:MAG: DinB family protein [Caldilineales bacterium]
MDARAEKLAGRLLAAHTELMTYAQALTPTEAAAPSPNPGWSVQDTLAHLASAELGHCSVAENLLSATPTIGPDGFDLDAFNAAQVAARRGLALAAVLSELDANHAATLALLQRIEPEQWDIAGYHPGGFDTTVEGVFRVIAIHKRRHMKELVTPDDKL